MNTRSVPNPSRFPVLAGALLLCAAPMALQGQFDCFTNNGAITITGYAGPGGAVTIPAQINGLPVTSIGYVFWGSSIEVFAGSDLTSVTVPDSVTFIDDLAFGFCTNLSAINVSAQNPVYSSLDGVLFDKSQSTLILFPMGLGGSYAVPNSVTNIEDYAFYNCARLTSVAIPDHVALIGEGAFDECSSLSGVAIPNTVTNIGFYTFWGCSNLATVTIGKGVTNIGDYAFTHCEHLTGVYFKGDPPGVGSAVFGYNNVFDPATIYYLPNTSGWSNTFAGRPTVLWLPQAQASGSGFGVRSNQFGFNISWASGQTVVVEACTNLANPTWIPLAANTLTSDTVYFSDPQWTNCPARFYRLRGP